jgi:isoleucyl-tRNA synthetase
MPFAQHHYPFENKDKFEQQFPAKFISEAVDQTRGWFYSLMAISTLLFDKSPYENVIVLGLVQDENGQKMSKSKGNAVDPFDALANLGADAIRWYFYTNSAPWLPNRFHDKAVIEGQRKFMGTLWNTYAFYILYAEIDKFDPTKHTLDYSGLTIMDRWLLSRLNTLIKTVDGYLSSYAIPEAARALQSFVDDMSNWYVRRGRERFWKQNSDDDKINAYMTLYTALVTVIKLAAPMIPFMTEDIYQNLVRNVDSSAPESVHLCDYPVADDKYINKELEAYMDEVLTVVALGRAARNSANIKNRQPLGRMFVGVPRELPEEYLEIVEDELNIKSVEFVNDSSSYVSYAFKPQLKTLGPKYGKLLGGIRNALQNLDGSAAKKELDTEGAIKLSIDGNEISLAAEDLLIETVQKEGYQAESDNGITVVLDTNLTDELIEEGFVRELTSKIQDMRKKAGFEVMDTIQIFVDGNEKIYNILMANKDSVCRDVLATAVNKGISDTASFDLDINGEKVTMGVKKN